MNKNVIPFLLLTIMLTACSALQPLPTATSVPTETATLMPTNTPEPTITPTLEPWMHSLPENVDSVEVGDEQVIGLDSQGNKVMVYLFDTGEWKTLKEPEPGMVIDETTIVTETSMDTTINGAKMQGSMVMLETPNPDDDELPPSKISLSREVVDWFMSGITANYIYYHGANPGTGELEDAQIKEITKQIAKMQAGEISTEEMVVDAKVVLNEDVAEGTQDVRLVFFPEGQPVPEGARAVNEIQIAFSQYAYFDPAKVESVVKQEWPAFKKSTAFPSGIGINAVLIGDSLAILVGPETMTDSSNIHKVLPTRASGIPNWVRYHKSSKGKFAGVRGVYEELGKYLRSAGFTVSPR